MDKSELITHLQTHLTAPQPSERWAMYRLISPVVDFANQSLGLKPYFEFNQTSNHGTHQSVDIALLDRYQKPRVLIEAKRIDRSISPEQIDKYLSEDVRGVVSNGELWILCKGNEHACLSIVEGMQLNLDALDEVIAYIKGRASETLKFKANPAVYRSTVKPEVVMKREKSVRKVYKKIEVAHPSDFSNFIESLKASPTIEKALLSSIEDMLKAIVAPEHLKIEVRKTRVSFFDQRRSNRSQRVARIELGKQHPDILVLTDIVDQFSEFSAIAPSTIHDKGAHMRRFRIDDDAIAGQFGQLLVKALSGN